MFCANCGKKFIIDDFEKAKRFDKFRFKSLVKARDNLNTSFHLWMTFFIVSIGSLFIGYYTLSGKICENNIEINVILILGYIISLFWHFSCKGYYWWVHNWINLIMDCERYLPERMSIYSCFINKYEGGNYYCPTKPANISTGKILGVFSFLVTVAWGVLLFQTHKTILINCFVCISRVSDNDYFIISIIGAIIISLLLCRFAKFFNHNMDNHKNIYIEKYIRR